ncbi:hypothetical protein FOH38_19665 [Lysinibacillus fusiformis]|nr:hypothetical protein FOH38_19665 [Lysinibacillus fusiformis]
MLSKEAIAALLKQPQTKRPATQIEKEQFFLKLGQQLSKREELAIILTNREQLQLFVDVENDNHYSFQLKCLDDPYTVNDSYFVKLE